MMREETKDQPLFKVVIDHEEQYSIWPADRENPLGWTDAGKIGTEEECENFIKVAGSGRKSRNLKEETTHDVPEETGGERGDL